MASENSYVALKTILEGSIERPPENILLYANSPLAVVGIAVNGVIFGAYVPRGHDRLRNNFV